MKDRVLVAGLGEVGQSLFEIIEESGKFDVFGQDPRFERQVPSRVEILHICFPYMQGFIDTVVEYVNKFGPYLTIINSTVPPQTSAKIAKRCPNTLVAYSPVLGIHKTRESFKTDIKYYGKFVGGVTEYATREARKHFAAIGIITIPNSSSLEAEITKLYETTYYGSLIALAQEFHRLSHAYGANFAEIMKNICYLHDMSDFKPPVYPDVIGGHCVMPNIEILLSIENSDLLTAIKRSNEFRKIEVKDTRIAKEIAETKEVVDKYWEKARRRLRGK